MVAVVDYGMGNLHSMAKALEYVGAEVVVTSHEDDLKAAERIVLPGVGSFGEAIQNLRATGLVQALEEDVFHGGKPLLGVCLGMQMLAGESMEHGAHTGLGWLDASIQPVEATEPDLKIPHTGWNEIELASERGLPFANIKPSEAFYFNHSFHLVPERDDVIAARCYHGQPLVAAVAWDNIVATQFHPEKSQRAGLEFLADFVDWQP